LELGRRIHVSVVISFLDAPKKATASSTDNGSTRSPLMTSFLFDAGVCAPSVMARGCGDQPERSSPATKRSRNTNFWIFPDGVSGKFSTNTHCCGVLYGARVSRQ